MPPPPISCSGRSSDRCFSHLSSFSVRAVALAFHSADLPLFLAAFFKLSQSLRFFLLNQPVSPPRYSLHRQCPQPDALHILHRMLLLDQHAPHLFLFRIPHPHFIPKIRRASPRCVRLPHRLHSYANLFSQPLQVRQRQHSLHFDVIHLLQLRPIFEHLRRQVAVIRHEHQPRCRILEIPYREHALRQSPQKVSQRLPPLRVRHRRHHFRRLVQQNVHAPPFFRFDDSPRRLNPVFRRVRLRPQLPDHAPIHAHLSAGDQQLRMPSRSNPRPRNNLLQSFFHFFFLIFSVSLLLILGFMQWRTSVRQSLLLVSMWGGACIARLIEALVLNLSHPATRLSHIDVDRPDRRVIEAVDRPNNQPHERRIGYRQLAPRNGQDVHEISWPIARDAHDIQVAAQLSTRESVLKNA